MEKENEILLSKLKLKKKKRNLTEEISSDDDNESLYLKLNIFIWKKIVIKTIKIMKNVMN